MRTLKELAQESIDVQNACNLSGVVHGFSRTMTDLWAHVNAGTAGVSGRGTDSVNNHPISILWADKIASLTGTQDLGSDVVSKAYRAVYDLLNAPTSDTTGQQ